MAVAVLDVDVDRLPEEIAGLDRYGAALIMIRLHGRPVGQVTVPVGGGRIGCAELRQAVLEGGGWQLWERWLHVLTGWDEGGGANAPPPPRPPSNQTWPVRAVPTHW